MHKTPKRKLILDRDTVRALVLPAHTSAKAAADTMTCTEPTYSICAAGCWPG